jgi:UDP-glucose 4-epimerase
MRKVLITGPTGAVGVSLIQELISRGIEVTAVCRRGSKRISAVPSSPLVTVVECNLSEMSSLAETLPHDYDAFYHFAWDGTYGETRQDISLQVSNIVYTIDAVHLAKQLGCAVFVGAGSQSEFGHVAGVLHPDTPCNPDNGYGIAKLAAGNLSRIECQKLGMRHVWCRIISLYGPYDGKHTMVMSGIYSMLEGKRPVYTKGEQVWDYIYSKDAARAFYLVAEKGKDGSIYCFGSGKTKLLKEYIQIIRDTIDPGIEIGIGELPYYPNQVMHLEADISNLTEDTGFVPRYSFEEGIRETIQWVVEQKNNG